MSARLRIRGISSELPRKVYEEAEERFFDKETRNLIAVKRVELYGKWRDVIVVYRIEDETAILLTVHPLKEGQKENRIVSGRWVRI